MSISGAAQNNLSIDSLLAAKQYALATAEIKLTTDSTLASAIWTQLRFLCDSNCWLAFLQNPHLNHCLTAKDLQYIFAITRRRYRESMSIHQLKILKLILHTPQWCTLLGYDYYILGVEYDKDTAVNCVKLDFLKQLSESQLIVLGKRLFCNLYAFPFSDLMHALQDLLKEAPPQNKRALNALKELFIETGYEVLFLSPGFKDASDALRLEFDKDADFAVAVLKNRKICTFWLGIDSRKAVSHSLFQVKHYGNLIDYYSVTNKQLSLAYEVLALGELVKQLSLAPKASDTMEMPPTFLPSQAPQPASAEAIEMISPDSRLQPEKPQI